MIRTSTLFQGFFYGRNRIRRDGLKSHGIDCVQDYLDRRESLAKYLTTEWLRLTLDHVDKKNKNQSKARTLPLWQ